MVIHLLTGLGQDCRRNCTFDILKNQDIRYVTLLFLNRDTIKNNYADMDIRGRASTIGKGFLRNIYCK